MKQHVPHADWSELYRDRRHDWLRHQVSNPQPVIHSRRFVNYSSTGLLSQGVLVVKFDAFLVEKYVSKLVNVNKHNFIAKSAKAETFNITLSNVNLAIHVIKKVNGPVNRTIKIQIPRTIHDLDGAVFYIDSSFVGTDHDIKEMLLAHYTITLLFINHMRKISDGLAPREHLFPRLTCDDIPFMKIISYINAFLRSPESHQLRGIFSQAVIQRFRDAGYSYVINDYNVFQITSSSMSKSRPLRTFLLSLFTIASNTDFGEISEWAKGPILRATSNRSKNVFLSTPQMKFYKWMLTNENCTSCYEAQILRIEGVIHNPYSYDAIRTSSSKSIWFSFEFTDLTYECQSHKLGRTVYDESDIIEIVHEHTVIRYLDASQDFILRLGSISKYALRHSHHIVSLNSIINSIVSMSRDMIIMKHRQCDYPVTLNIRMNTINTLNYLSTLVNTHPTLMNIVRPIAYVIYLQAVPPSVYLAAHDTLDYDRIVFAILTEPSSHDLYFMSLLKTAGFGLNEDAKRAAIRANLD